MRTLGLIGVAVGVALVAGCATAQPGAAGPSSAGPTGTSSSACATALVLTDEDNQTEVCVAKGGTVTLELTGGGGTNWSPIQLGGTGLTEQSPASGTTAGTTARYLATAAGTAQLTSSRSACPPPSPGAAACHAMQAFTVTVTVR